MRPISIILILLLTLITVPLNSRAHAAFEGSDLKISQIPAGGSANSSTKFTSTSGEIHVEFRIRTASLLNFGGRSSYRVTLRRGVAPSSSGESGTVVASKVVTTDNTAVLVQLSAPVSTCSEVGGYHVRVTNTSPDNPQAAIVSSGLTDGQIYAASTNPEYRPLWMAGYSLLDLARGDEKTVSLGSFAKSGTIRLKGKWHVPELIPTFKPLAIYLLRPDGTTAKSGQFFSIHANLSPRLDTYYFVTPADAAQSGDWKLKIVNRSDSPIEQFNIKKGADVNPFVPQFESNFTNACGS